MVLHFQQKVTIKRKLNKVILKSTKCQRSNILHWVLEWLCDDHPRVWTFCFQCSWVHLPTHEFGHWRSACHCPSSSTWKTFWYLWNCQDKDFEYLLNFWKMFSMVWWTSCLFWVVSIGFILTFKVIFTLRSMFRLYLLITYVINDCFVLNKNTPLFLVQDFTKP